MSSRKETSTDSGPPSRQHSKSGADAVWQLEITFFYPFRITERGLARLSAHQSDKRANHIFGDDGHLLFKEDLLTIPVEMRRSSRVQRLASLAIDPRRGDPGLDESKSSMVMKPYALATLKDSAGNVYTLHEAFVRLFRFDIGILRFVVRAQQSVSVQDVLNVQNSIMRLGDPKQAGRMTVTATDEPFEPRPFLQETLRHFVGEEDVDWVADSHTDRLFVYTLAAIRGQTSDREVKSTLYNIGQMEWDVDAAVADENLDEFKQKHCFLRFAQNTTGLFTSFHRDGGATLYFGEVSPDQLPMFSEHRRAKTSAMVCGTTRPLSAYSLSEAILFQRTYLRSLDQNLHELIVGMDQRRVTQSVKILQGVHGGLIRFRAEFGATPVSSSSSCQKQFDMWNQIMGLAEVDGKLHSSISDLHSFYSEQSAEASQQRLDALAVVLGFIGLAQLFIDIFSNFTVDGGNKGNQNFSLLYVPTVVTLLFIIAGLLFIYVTRSAL